MSRSHPHTYGTHTTSQNLLVASLTTIASPTLREYASPNHVFAPELLRRAAKHLHAAPSLPPRFFSSKARIRFDLTRLCYTIYVLPSMLSVIIFDILPTWPALLLTVYRASIAHFLHLHP
jgi:hypothetical protein